MSDHKCEFKTITYLISNDSKEYYLSCKCGAATDLKPFTPIMTGASASYAPANTNTGNPIVYNIDDLLDAAKTYCNTPADSAAFHPDQKVTQGQIKTAQNLLDYLLKLC